MGDIMAKKVAARKDAVRRVTAKKAAAKRRAAKRVTPRSNAKTILAVAIGDEVTEDIDSQSFSTDTVRPYIRGLVNGLTGEGLDIGKAYVIKYRQRTDLNSVFPTNTQPNCIFAMSTTVVRKAKDSHADIPIIGIVSDPQKQGFLDPNVHNVFGVSARRTQSALQCYQHFERTAPNRPMYVLHDPKYGPSCDALDSLRGGGHQFNVLQVTPANIQGVIRKRNPGDNLLILPVDWFFGMARDISSWAQSAGVADFWSVTDWVRADTQSAFGGYGVSQQECGRVMADLVANVLREKTPRNKFINATIISWRANEQVAGQVGVQIPSNLPPPFELV
jgi:ABC-type uncharacterized transport system substrate-binding protein